MPSPFRSHFILFPLLLASLATGCTQAPSGTTLSLDDPLSLLDEVDGTLQLRIVPASAYTCSENLGMVTPDVRAASAVADAIVNIALPVTARGRRVTATAEVSLLAGDWVVAVFGDGTHSMSGEAFATGGCARVEIEAGETRDANIMLVELQEMGTCGDGVLGPTEQCDDGNQESTDGCSATCEAEALDVPLMTDGTQRDPVVAWSASSRAMVCYSDSGMGSMESRYYDTRGVALTAPVHLQVPREIERGVAPVTPITAQRAGRTFITYNNGPDVHVAYVAQGDDLDDWHTHTFDRSANMATRCERPSVGILNSGDAVVAMSCNMSDGSSGIMAWLFPNGADAPTVLGLLDFGMESPSQLAFVTLESQMLLVYLDGSRLMSRSIDGMGSLGETSTMLVDGVANQALSVGHLTRGESLVVYAGSDGMIRGVLLNASGGVEDSTLVLSDTPGNSPAAAGGSTHFAVTWQEGQSPIAAGVTRARHFDLAGQPVLSRGADASSDSFVISATSSSHGRVAASGNQVLYTWWDQSRNAGDVLTLLLPLP